MTRSLFGLVVLFLVQAAWGGEPGIEVRTDIPFGNAANVRVVSQGKVTEVRFTADPHGGPESLWFCFRVCRRRPGGVPLGQLRIVLECPETMLGGGSGETMRPVVCLAGGDWQRVDAPELLELPDGRRQAAWRVESPTPSFDFAFCYPYGRNDLARMIEETGHAWHVDTLGVSQGGRPLLRLSNDYGKPKGRRPGLYLLARQHSGEMSGSWVLDGVLRRFAELGDAAPLVWAVPLANIDGVEQGDYGKDNFPCDLNRAWGQPAMRHETLIFQQDIRRWAQRCQPIATFDFHSPGGGETTGIYAFIHVSEKVLATTQKAEVWATVFAEGLGKAFAAQQFARKADYPSRWETPRFSGFCQEQIGIPSLSFETPYAMVRQTVLTRELYREAGKRMADSIVARLKATAPSPSE